MKRILIICGSPRKGGNSDLLAEKFAKGAVESGHKVETVHLRDLQLNYCVGCLSCLKTGHCFQKDDANGLLPKMMEADVLVLACPVYYYSVCGQMKVFLDRMNPLYGLLKGKELYYIVTAVDNNKTQLDRAMDALQGWADCFEGMQVRGRIYGGGADKKGDIISLPAYHQAYTTGKTV